MVIGEKAKLTASRRAANITYAALRAPPKYFQLGMTERQLAWRMGRLLEKFGSTKRAFPVIAAFGEQSAQPHHVPNSRRLRSGDIIKVDAGAVWRQHRGDVTRTCFFGRPRPPQKFCRRYLAVYRAQQLAFRQIRAGVSGKAIDKIARVYLHRRGLGKYFIHGLGHGVGRAIHQPPFLTPKPKGRRQLRVGEVVTNEPGVYELGWGGIRIEDMVEVTARGPRWLGTAPRLLHQIIIQPPEKSVKNSSSTK